MTVAELIKALETCDPDKEVLVSGVGPAVPLSIVDGDQDYIHEEDGPWELAGGPDSTACVLLTSSSEDEDTALCWTA